MSGRRREREPQASIYNRLCDMEWDTPIGPCRSCHGDAMMRRIAFEAAGMFDETMIAGEEPELCVRLRAKGWTLERIDAEMTLHDAAMTRLGQWWKRMVRAGHAYAEGADKHGAPPEYHNVRQVRSALLWGIGFPLVTIAFVPVAVTNPYLWIFVVLNICFYFDLIRRVYSFRRSRNDSQRDARLYSVFTVLGKVPLSLGVLKYYLNKLLGRRSRLIEYKSEGAVRG